jgi:chemotaxis protein methyltransferase CheR
MKDCECVLFLQWVLPKMELKWRGFRKVRRQVCKRIARRIRYLGLKNITAYRHFLETNTSEWQVLDAMCYATVSCFYRDKKVFAYLERAVLPQLVRSMISQERNQLKVWSIGCCAGEEPHSLALLWQLRLNALFPSVTMDIVASDSDPVSLKRAAQACYKGGSLKHLPPKWLEMAFRQDGNLYCLLPRFKRTVRFVSHDVRHDSIKQQYDLVLC